MSRQWASGALSFDDRCIQFVELMGTRLFDELLEPFVIWGDRPVPANVPESKFPEVYAAMVATPGFLEGLRRTGRRGMSLQIINEAHK